MGALFRTGGINPPSAKAPVRSQRRLDKLAPALFTLSVLLAVVSGRFPVVSALRYAHRTCSSRSYGSAAPRLFRSTALNKKQGYTERKAPLLFFRAALGRFPSASGCLSAPFPPRLSPRGFYGAPCFGLEIVRNTGRLFWARLRPSGNCSRKQDIEDCYFC